MLWIKKIMNNEILDKLKTLISKEWGVDEQEISAKSHLRNDLDADLLSVSDLMVKIENEFQIKIPANQSHMFQTVNDILEYVSEQSGEI